MERLCSLALGIPLLGHAYRVVHTTLYKDAHIVQQCDMVPCDVHRGYRTRARTFLSKQWQRSTNGFVRMADPLLANGLVYFGWEAPKVCGGGCGGHEFPLGLCGHLAFKVRLRRTRALQEEGELCCYCKLGVEAPCGALGTRLVRPKLWSPVASELLDTTRFVSSDGRFLNVHVRWVGAE